MTESSWPFENADTSEQQYSTLLSKISDTGVEGGSATNDLRVTADSGGMRVFMNAGRANLFGFQYFNDSQLTKTLSAASSQARIDSVVLRLDTSANSIVAAILTGTPGAAPQPPALQQSSVPITVWEERIANVFVPANATSIAPGNVTDVRRFTGHKYGSWTTANRPVSPAKGRPGFNESLGYPEYWDGNTWKPFSSASTPATQITGTVPNSALDYGVVAAFRNDRTVDAPTNGDGINGDWNAVLQPGVYRVYAGNTNTNAPGGAYMFGTLMVVGGGQAIASRTQVYFSHQSRVYTRTAWNGNDWGGWAALAAGADVDNLLNNVYNKGQIDGALGARDTRLTNLENSRTTNISGAGVAMSGSTVVNNFVKDATTGMFVGKNFLQLPTWLNGINPVATAYSADAGGVTAQVTDVTKDSFWLVVTRRNNFATTAFWHVFG